MASPPGTGNNEMNFWDRVDKSGDCWLWTRARSHGYGKVWSPDERRVVSAHRVAWELTNGAIPDGLCVLHRCDNPPCVRPDHLFLGTIKDNNDDKLNKGRLVSGFAVVGYRGEKHWKARLTRQQAEEIRARSTEPRAALAAEFGVSVATIKAIRGGRLWQVPA